MLNHGGSGINNVGEYLVATIPWITGSSINGIKHHHFPCVTKAIVLKNLASSPGNIYMAFAQNAFSTYNFITLAPSESFSVEVKTKMLFISGTGNYELFAGLTTIPERYMPTLTGSNGNVESGIG